MVSDLIESSLVGYPLETLLFGGAPAHDQLCERARQAFPNAVMWVSHTATPVTLLILSHRSQAYGLTEINSVAVSVAGEDYVARPTSTGRPGPVNDVLIMKDSVAAPVGQVGEVWL